MTFEAYIEKRSTAYNEASAGIQEISDLPIGKYQGEIYETKITESKKNHEWYLRFGIKVLGPTHIGFKTSKLYPLAPPKEGRKDLIGILKKDLFTIGVELQDIKKLRDALEVVKGRKIDFDIWEKNGYLHVAIRKLVETGTVSEGPFSAPKPKSKETPLNESPF